MNMNIYAKCVKMPNNTNQDMQETSKFHREFMSPVLFLFELLKMGKLTRGPLLLYHLPKY